VSKHVKKLRGGKARPFTTNSEPQAIEVRFRDERSFGLHSAHNGSALILFISSGAMAMYNPQEAHEIGTALCKMADELTFRARGKK
jgi:hypothetical protein